MTHSHTETITKTAPEHSHEGSSHSHTESTHSHPTSNGKTSLITKDMLIGDIVEKFPDTVELMLSHGLHCVGCGASTFESLEQGTMGHGWTDTELDELVNDLNKNISTAKKNEKSGTEKFCNDGIFLSESAAKKVQELLTADNKIGWGIHIGVLPGGCSGYSYDLYFTEKADVGDTTFEHFGVKCFVDKESLAMLNGTTVDFVDGLMGSGFKFDNPNQQSGCGCGKSFA